MEGSDDLFEHRAAGCRLGRRLTNGERLGRGLGSSSGGGGAFAGLIAGLPRITLGTTFAPLEDATVRGDGFDWTVGMLGVDRRAVGATLIALGATATAVRGARTGKSQLCLADGVRESLRRKCWSRSMVPRN